MSDDIEQILRDQPLRRPSAALDARIAGALGDTSMSRFRLYVAVGLGAALAAGLLLAAWLGPPDADRAAPVGPVADAASAEGAMVRVDQVWSQVRHGDLLLTDDAEPVRPVRVQRLHHTRWIDEKQNVRIEMTVPEDRVVLVSASIQ